MTGPRGERTRERLLDAARQAFVEVGWSKARVEDVCRAAGVGHGTFYGYFANKASVLEALVRRHAADLGVLLESDWSSGEPRSDVHRVIDGFVAHSERDADVRAVWLAAATVEPALALLVLEVRGLFVDRVASHLTAAVAAGRARPDLDVALASGALAAMVEHSVAAALAAPGSVDRERLVDGLADLWLHAVYQP